MFGNLHLKCKNTIFALKQLTKTNIMKISFYGHATFMVEIKGKKILFDPFITHNPLAQEANISADSINPDYILISHGHADHIADAVGIATRTGAKVVANWEIHEWLNKQGVQNTHPMNTGGKWTFAAGHRRAGHSFSGALL